MIKVDTRGLSRPEPVMLTQDAIRAHKGEEICVLTDAGHSRTNIEKMLGKLGIEPNTVEKGSEFEITFTA